MRSLLTGLLLTVGLTACGGSRDPQADVERLTNALPVLQQLQVENYRNQDWCKNLAYQQGKFSNNRESTTCRIDETSQFFTDQANQAFGQVTSAIQQTQVPLYAVVVDYGSDGRIRRAEFLLTRPGGYIYEPGYRALPESLPNELEYTAVNQDWYSYWQDWN
jgi:hypothetical protein